MTDPDEAVHPSELEFDLALVDRPTARLDAHLAGCGRCRDQLERLRSEQALFRASEEPQRAAQVVADRLRQRSLRARLRRWLWIPTLATAFASAALVLMVRPTPGVRTKGAPRVALFVKQAGGAPLRWDGAPLHEGDAVQLEVDPAGFALTTVFSVDAGCTVTLEHAQGIEGGALIPASWTLRGPEGGERLYVAFSTRPVATAELAAALSRARACEPSGAPDVEADGFVARGVALRPKARP